MSKHCVHCKSILDDYEVEECEACKKDGGPTHIQYLRDIERRGFEGVDASVGISLFDYGIAWKEFKRAVPKYPVVKGEYLFYYATDWNDSGESTKFDFGYMRPDEFESTFDWADLGEVAKTSGADLEDWLEWPFHQRVVDLLNYYGFANVFGESYGNYFVIKGEV